MFRGRDIYGPGFWKGGPGWPGARGGGFWGAACRLYPWLPRRWWAYAPAAAGALALAAWAPWRQAWTSQDEGGFLREQADMLKAQLRDVEKRLSEIEGRSNKEQE